MGPRMRTKKKKSNNKCVKIETGLETGVSEDCTESQREWIEIHHIKMRDHGITIQFFFLFLSMDIINKTSNAALNPIYMVISKDTNYLKN